MFANRTRTITYFLFLLAIGIALGIVFAIQRDWFNNGISFVDDVVITDTLATEVGQNPDLSEIRKFINKVQGSGYLASQDVSYTLFLPTNADLVKRKTELDDLLTTGNEEAMQNVLKYHIVKGRILRSDLTDGKILKTLQGQDLKITVRNSQAYINGVAITADSYISTNGVLYLIKDLLIPGLNLEDLTVMTVAGANQDTTAVASMLNKTTLGATLKNKDGNFTIFAPRNSAFGAIQKDVNELLKPANQTKLINTLGLHAANTNLSSTDLTNGKEITVLNSSAKLTIEVEGANVYVKGPRNRAKIVQTNLPAINGTVHIIDTVLLF